MIRLGDLVMYVHPDEPTSGMLGTVDSIEWDDDEGWHFGVDLMHHDHQWGGMKSVVPIFNERGERITWEWLADYEEHYYDDR